MLAFTKCATPKGRPAPAQPEILEGESVPSPRRAPDHVHLEGIARRRNAFALQNRVLIRAAGAGWGHFGEKCVVACRPASTGGRWPADLLERASPHERVLTVCTLKIIAP